jgi:membrane-bound metal-dependent hydrolase YbcI (DUF457 family)
MPRRRVHVAVGSIGGAVAGVATSQHLTEGDQATHVLFAGIGGAVGGAAPDLLEPATSPNHRAFFHSLVVAGSLTAAWAADLAADCHRAAEACEARAACASDDGSRQWERLKAFLWRALAGFLVGLFAGYGSHLVLDAATSRGLPLFCATI